MMDPYDHIEEYINGQLSEQDRIVFEELMAKDDALKNAVEHHDVAMNIVSSLIEDEVRGVLSEEGSSSSSSRKTIVRKISNSTKWSIAASFIIMMSIGLYFTNKNIESNQFAARYQETKKFLQLPENSTTRGEVSIGNKLEEGVNLFELRQWEESKIVFSSLLGDNQYNNDTIQFYLGHIHYRLQDFDKAVYHFKNISTNSELNTQSEIMLGLSYYVLGNKEKAKVILSSHPTISFD